MEDKSEKYVKKKKVHQTTLIGTAFHLEIAVLTEEEHVDQVSGGCWVLQLAAWDLLCEHNNEDHRTSDAGSQRLLVPALPCDAALLRKALRQSSPCPNETSGTKASFPVSCFLEKTAWSSAVENQDRSSLTMFIFPPPDAQIGRYHLNLEVSTKGQGSSYYIGEFILLFNPCMTVFFSPFSLALFHLCLSPLCAEDTVYMESEEARIEYVLTQHGQIFNRNKYCIGSIPWMYGQFEKGIMDICLKMLDTSLNFLQDQDKDCSRHNSPVYVSRVVYFHCWAESWMGRPDLPEGYGGWQVLDPTPQEKSGDIYCCGPAPVKAIKEGDVHLKYDVPFVFAEVNADMVCYLRQYGMPWKVISIDTSKTGMNISTKSVGRDTREDITHLYKYPEGSKEERAVFAKARHKVQDQVQCKDSLPLKETLKVRIKVSEGINNGCDFDVFAVIKNNTAGKHWCELKIGTRIVSYNGALGPECRSKDNLGITLEPYEEKAIPFQILYKKYGQRLTQDNMIRVTSLLLCQDTQEYFVGMRNIYIKNPDIKIQILGEPMLNRRLVAELTLTNPLPAPLTDCVFTVQGAGLTGGQKVQKIDSPVGPGEEAKVKVDFVPFLSGPRKLVVNFESNKLKGVKGYCNINVAPIPK
ncbi:protein-glutamine gamma-glutamyltransferase 2-like [Anolis carolinensis]|uniref:protein-glutamine gamma-glutamyltransferase 2-like n=1 Tax=Anolis carolinensis TaxID=28377 RepID=UPI002F2B509F